MPKHVKFFKKKCSQVTQCTAYFDEVADKKSLKGKRTHFGLSVQSFMVGVAAAF